MTNESVTVYTQPGCSHCRDEKQWLDSKGVEYQERDVSHDEEALRKLKKAGSSSTPTTFVGDNPVIGFNRKKLEDLIFNQN